MYRLEREEFVQSPYIFLWGVLGFQAGFLNAFGFLACGRYVSHVTGFGTQIGIALAKSEFYFAVELLGFPASFILGSFVNGILTSSKIERGEKPKFHLVTAIIPILILFLLFIGSNGWFGPFGEDLIRPRDFVLLFLLSFVCGLQNGCFAVLTKGQIRTTHLTGISTDIGTDLARLLNGNLGPVEHELTYRVNLSRFVTFFSFAIGSVISVSVSQIFGHYSLIVPALTSVIIFIAAKMIGRFLDRKFLQSPTV